MSQMRSSGVSVSVSGAVVVALLSGGLALASAPVTVAKRAHNGLIAYTFFGNATESPSTIWTIKPDGSGNRRLLSRRSGFVWGASGPRWSRDGKRLLFYGHRALDGPEAVGSVWYTTASAKRVTRIPVRAPDVAGYDWAPDGRHVVVSLRTAGLAGPATVYRMALDGTHRKKLRHGVDPSWSRDGRNIVFVTSSGDIAIVRPDGSGFRLLTESRHDTNPSFSPGGQKVIFLRSHLNAVDGGSVQWRTIDVSRRNGALIKTMDVSSSSSYYCAPRWSPDGLRLAALRQDALTPLGRDGAMATTLTTFSPSGHGERVAFTFPASPAGYGAPSCEFSWQALP